MNHPDFYKKLAWVLAENKADTTLVGDVAVVLAEFNHDFDLDAFYERAFGVLRTRISF